jgi:hypothetical protein
MGEKMSGGGGLTIYNVLLFYSIFLFFTLYMSTLAGVSILSTQANPSGLTPPTSFIDAFSVIGFFIDLVLTNSTYQILFITLVFPFAVMIVYAILQLIRGTG